MSSHDHPRQHSAPEIPRRVFLQGAAVGTAVVAIGNGATLGGPRQDPSAVIAQIAKRHDTTVNALQDWIKLPSIAAENIGYPAGADYMARLARDAGFQQVEIIPTKGKPSVFATLDAGARRDLPRPGIPSSSTRAISRSSWMAACVPGSAASGSLKAGLSRPHPFGAG